MDIESVTLGPRLGEGSFAAVYELGSDPSQVVKVMKFGKEEEMKMPSVIREINANSCLESAEAGMDPSEKLAARFSSACRYCFHQSRGFTVMFFYPKMAGGTLESAMRSASPVMKSMSWKITTMSFLLRALRRIHQAGLIHRDIKPANIMFPTEDLKFPRFIDFGFSIKAESSSETLGTPEYTAPEIVAILNYSPGHYKAGAVRPKAPAPYTNKVDVFSLGLVFFELVTGAKLRKNKDGVYYEPSYPASTHSTVQNLINNMLEMNPEHRLDVFEAYEESKTMVAALLI